MVNENMKISKIITDFIMNKKIKQKLKNVMRK